MQDNETYYQFMCGVLHVAGDVAYGRAPGLLSARMHDWSPCEVGRTRETGSLPHTELGASISSRRAAPLLEAQVTLHRLSVESVLAAAAGRARLEYSSHQAV